jgi:hypothetical protein
MILCEELYTGEVRYIYISLRGQVYAYAYTYTQLSHNNAYQVSAVTLPVCNLGERSARLKAPPNSIDRLIVLIQTVLYGRSLAVHSNGSRLGCLPRRP